MRNKIDHIRDFIQAVRYWHRNRGKKRYPMYLDCHFIGWAYTDEKQ